MPFEELKKCLNFLKLSAIQDVLEDIFVSPMGDRFISYLILYLFIL